MLGKITNPETIKKNQEWTEKIISEAKAKGIEITRKEDVKVDDMLYIHNAGKYFFKKITADDIRTEYGFIKIEDTDNMNPTVQKFVF